MSNNDWNLNTSNDDFSAMWDSPVPEAKEGPKGRSGNDGFQPDPRKVEKVKGPWHWALTLLTFLLVGTLSFLMAFLTKAVEERSPLLMGLIFAVPMAAMFLASLLMEYRTSAMTPSFLRKTQAIIAAVAVLATFCVGVLCDWIYLYGFVEPIERKTVFVLDKSASMTRDNRNESMARAMDEIINAMDDTEEVGLILFHDSVCKEMPIEPLSVNAQSIRNTITRTPADGGGTSFYVGMTGALKLFEDKMRAEAAAGNGPDDEDEVISQIIFLTDGENPLFVNVAEGVKTRCLTMGVTVHGIAFSSDGKLDAMQSLISATGGTIVKAENADELMEVMYKLTKQDADLLRSQNGSANLMSGIMLVLEGLVIGLGLWLMLSVHGQFRVQAILSPLLGVISLALLKFAGFHAEMEIWWIIEGIAFTLLGLVFMTKNRLLNQAESQKPEKTPAKPPEPPVQIPDFDF